MNDGSRRCFVKLTGIYRFSTAPGFADVKPFAEALIATAPAQLIWGSDFPHLSFHDRVGELAHDANHTIRTEALSTRSALGIE